MGIRQNFSRSISQMSKFCNNRFFFSIFGFLCFFLSERNRLIKSPQFSLKVFDKIRIFILVNEPTLRGVSGPRSLIRSIIASSKTFSGKCVFQRLPIDYTTIINSISDKEYFWIFNGEGFCNNIHLIQRKAPQNSRKIILGPVVAPQKWNLFPSSSICFEKNWSKTIDSIGLYVVHSQRVMNHLVNRSFTNFQLHKYAIMRACTNTFPQNLQTLQKRYWDIIFYEKYMDVDHAKAGKTIFHMLKEHHLKIKRISYKGLVPNASGYNASEIAFLANNSKSIFYFSFWDTGAIALKEIQNFGVYTFTVQQDLTGLFGTFLKINFSNPKNEIDFIQQKIRNLSRIEMNELSSKIQYENSCTRSLEEICNAVHKSRKSIQIT